jgi:hypothetical protein
VRRPRLARTTVVTTPETIADAREATPLLSALTRVSVTGSSVSSPRALTLRSRATDRPRWALVRRQPDPWAWRPPHGLGRPRPVRVRGHTVRDTPNGSHGLARRRVGDAGKAARTAVAGLFLRGGPIWRWGPYRRCRAVRRRGDRRILRFDHHRPRVPDALLTYGPGAAHRCQCLDRQIDQSDRKPPGSPHRTARVRHGAGSFSRRTSACPESGDDIRCGPNRYEPSGTSSAAAVF